jgi:hypothetical protein
VAHSNSIVHILLLSVEHGAVEEKDDRRDLNFLAIECIDGIEIVTKE